MSTPQLVEVKVQQGILRGQRVVPEDGPTYDAFRGIPYAQKPLGPLRFKAPRPPEPWEGARPALEEGSPAPQHDLFAGLQLVGKEDCLYLNVYTPQVPSSVAARSPGHRSGSPWPIMVWIHPGGFVNGSGSAREYSPELLIAKDVVVVTINYRLGALGFLSLGSPAATGNYGLKDVIAALRWVKANGAVFGGDTESVTIFGCSAGSAIVQLLHLSPLSKGLFHRAIAQSGSSINPWPVSFKPRERALRLATTLGATDADLKDDESTLEFLRAQTTTDLVEGTIKIVTPEDYDTGLTFMFLPASEENLVPNDPQDEVFLPGLPWDLLKKGDIIDVPLITGFTDTEGIIVDMLSPAEGAIKAAPEVLSNFDANLEKGLTPELRRELPPEKKKEGADRLRKVFFGGGAVNEANKLAYYNLQSDLIFNIGILREARIHAKHTTSSVYVYSFGVRGRINRVSQLLQKKPEELIGACHGDELSYLWNTGAPLPPIPKLEPQSIEALTRERIVTLWTNFAKTGNPTPEGKPVDGVTWPELPKDVGSSVPYLDIGAELTVPQAGIIQERIELWDSLYSQLN